MPLSTAKRLVTQMGESHFTPFEMTCTTTAPAQTLTLQQITPLADVIVTWGDGTSEVIAAGKTGTTTHQYASAGTYAVTISKPDVLTTFDVRDAKLTINMTAQAAKLRNMTGSLRIDNATVTWVVSDAAPVPQGLTGSLYFSGASIALTWTVAASGGAAMPQNLTNNLYFNGNSIALTWTPETAVGTRIPRNCSTYRITTTWLTAAVDAFIDAAYTVWAAGGITKAATWHLAGGNQAATGTYAANCPPTTPKEKAYQMVFDTCGLGRLKQASWTLN